MKELMPLVITLTFIAAAAGLCLAVVYMFTEDPIAAAERENTLKAIRFVLPPFDNSLLSEIIFKQTGEEEGHTFFIARAGEGELVGVAFPWASREGYSGELEVMIGVVPDGEGYKINSIEILRHQETPGLGSKIGEDKFKGQFSSATLDNRTFEVDKDSSGAPGKPPIDSITGATISSRAVTEAVINGFNYFLNNNKNILTTSGSNGESQ